MHRHRNSSTVYLGSFIKIYHLVLLRGHLTKQVQLRNECIGNCNFLHFNADYKSTTIEISSNCTILLLILFPSVDIRSRNTKFYHMHGFKGFIKKYQNAPIVSETHFKNRVPYFETNFCNLNGEALISFSTNNCRVDTNKLL